MNEKFKEGLSVILLAYIVLAPIILPVVIIDFTTRENLCDAGYKPIILWGNAWIAYFNDFNLTSLLNLSDAIGLVMSYDDIEKELGWTGFNRLKFLVDREIKLRGVDDE